MDFRFQKYIRLWQEKELKRKTFDLVGFAGCTKNLTVIIKQIEISVKLHGTENVYLIHHEDCGYYKDKSTFERHKKDLLKAEKKILSLFPKVKVKLFYLHLDGRFEAI